VPEERDLCEHVFWRAYFTNTMSLEQFILMDFLKRKTSRIS